MEILNRSEDFTPEMIEKAIVEAAAERTTAHFGERIIHRKVKVDRKGRRYEFQLHATKGIRKYRVY